MPDIILHHYDSSPFSEKIRLVLGAKALAWKSVEVPRIMPKPDVVALTGGYRRTPFMQIGADIYCDTALIAATLDRLAPAPPLFPPALAASARALAQVADTTLFGQAVGVVFQGPVLERMFAGAPELLQAFVQDRAAMRRNASVRRLPLAEARAGLLGALAALEAQLGDARDYLLGAAPTMADFSTYHPLWFVQRAPLVGGLLDVYPGVLAWMGRMRAIGHGRASAITAAEAIEAARAASPAPLAGGCEPDGPTAGSRVEVMPTDYGIDPVAGELLACDRHAIAVRRIDPRAGELVVHFPRLNYELRVLS